MGHRIFDFVCQAVAEWNRIFSFPALLIITTRLVTIACNLFAFIQGLVTRSNEYISDMGFPTFIGASLDCFMLAFLFAAADLPVKAVRFSNYH